MYNKIFKPISDVKPKRKGDEILYNCLHYKRKNKMDATEYDIEFMLQDYKDYNKIKKDSEGFFNVLYNVLIQDDNFLLYTHYSNAWPEVDFKIVPNIKIHKKKGKS